MSASSPVHTFHNNLLAISWVIIGLSVLTDISNVRSFPSYNTAIGVMCCYCGFNPPPPSQTQVQTPSSTNINKNHKIVSVFVLLCAISLFFDVIFCLLWGSSIFSGYSSSVKFSLVVFIVNMFVKCGSIYFGTGIVTMGGGGEGEGNVENFKSSPYDPGGPAPTSPGNVAISFAIGEEEDEDEDEDENEDARSPINSRKTNSNSPIPQIRQPPPPPPSQN